MSTPGQNATAQQKAAAAAVQARINAEAKEEQARAQAQARAEEKAKADARMQQMQQQRQQMLLLSQQREKAAAEARARAQAEARARELNARALAERQRQDAIQKQKDAQALAEKQRQDALQAKLNAQALAERQRQDAIRARALQPQPPVQPKPLEPKINPHIDSNGRYMDDIKSYPAVQPSPNLISQQQAQAQPAQTAKVIANPFAQGRTPVITDYGQGYVDSQTLMDDSPPARYKKGGQVKVAQDTKKKYTSGGKINLNECRISTAQKNKKNSNW